MSLDMGRVRAQIAELVPHFEGLAATETVTMAFLMQAQGMVLALEYALNHPVEDVEASLASCQAVADELAGVALAPSEPR